VCEQNTALLIVKVSGTCSYHWALNGYVLLTSTEYARRDKSVCSFYIRHTRKNEKQRYIVVSLSVRVFITSLLEGVRKLAQPSYGLVRNFEKGRGVC
jgi:hypothetical protein